MIQVDVRGEQIGRRVPVRIPLVGTVRHTIDALLPLITPKTDSAHLDRMTAHYKRARGRLDKLADDRRNQSPLHPHTSASHRALLHPRRCSRRTAAITARNVMAERRNARSCQRRIASTETIAPAVAASGLPVTATQF